MVILFVRGGSPRKVVPGLGCQVGPAARERNAGQLDEDGVDKFIPNLWKTTLLIDVGRGFESLRLHKEEKPIINLSV